MSKPYTLPALIQKGLIPEAQQDEIRNVAEQFSVVVSEHLLSAMEAAPDLSQDPLALQFLPRTEELDIKPEERKDPLGEDRWSPVKGIIHRYPDRCLLIPMTVCPTYCRFCFRREKVAKKDQSLSKQELEAAYRYIADHPALWEVILSGGEPLMLGPAKIKAIIQVLNTIEHVKVVRIHTRLPVVDPESVTEGLMEALDSPKAVYVILHANHASELNDKTLAACRRFIKAGIPLLSQTVLLKGINDDPLVLGELMRTLVSHRIKPYYLHHGDLAQGTTHFRTSIAKGQDLVQALRGHYSGLCQPTYVLDIPGGHGKMPIHPSAIQAMPAAVGEAQRYSVEDYQGCTHEYVECL